MYIMASFEYSPYIEMALCELQEHDIDKTRIIAIPLDKRVEEQQIFDSLHRSDGQSSLTMVFIFGFIFMLLGAIYGFVLAWGPIIWGLIGLLLGAALGLLAELALIKRRRKQYKAYVERTTEVIVTIECSEQQSRVVEQILWKHYAIGVGRLTK